ncbi:MAG: hypothetical protein NTW94_01190 [Legionellales bacterium]|nr:hypothetical protein [Legionellales bacterium]
MTPAKLAELLQREFDNRRITIKQISESTVAAKYFSSGPLQSAMLCLLAKDILGEKNSEDKWPKKEELWEQEVRRPGILAKIFANKLGPFNLSWANLRTDLPGILPDISNHFTSGRFQAAYERHLDSPVAKVIADMRQKLELGRLLEGDRLGAKNIEKKPPGT